MHGWAYGRGGTALHGKMLLSAISTGGPEPSYQPEGFHGHTLLELAALREDRTEYLDHARRRIADMEEVLRAETGQRAGDTDAAWDTSSIRREVAEARS